MNTISKNGLHQVASIQTKPYSTLKTQDELLDNFLSGQGGFAQPAVYLLAGNPGSGKTTLVLNICDQIAPRKSTFLCREEFKNQLLSRFANRAWNNPNFNISDQDDHKNFDDFLTALAFDAPELLVIDSLQIIAETDYADMGIKEASIHIRNLLTNFANEHNCTVIIINQVNKDGTLKGCNEIAHMVDAVMYLMFDDEIGIRQLYWKGKNRYGSIEKKLFFNMVADGRITLTETAQLDIKTFESHMVASVTIYISQFKQHKNYVDFKKEFSVKEKEIFSKNENNFPVYVSELTLLASRLVEKFNFLNS